MSRTFMTTPAYFTSPNDDFWLNTVRSLGSNSATDGFASIEELVTTGKLSARELRKLASACRSLMDMSRDRASEMEAREKRPWEFRGEFRQVSVVRTDRGYFDVLYGEETVARDLSTEAAGWTWADTNLPPPPPMSKRLR